MRQEAQRMRLTVEKALLFVAGLLGQVERIGFYPKGSEKPVMGF